MGSFAEDRGGGGYSMPCYCAFGRLPGHGLEGMVYVSPASDSFLPIGFRVPFFCILVLLGESEFLLTLLFDRPLLLRLLPASGC
jgi:hypothetical protein